MQAEQTIKPNINQAPINREILEVEIDFDFEKKPTLSAQPVIKVQSSVLPIEKKCGRRCSAADNHQEIFEAGGGAWAVDACLSSQRPSQNVEDY